MKQIFLNRERLTKKGKKSNKRNSKKINIYDIRNTNNDENIKLKIKIIYSILNGQDMMMIVIHR